MARYTGPVWKQSRRIGFSILETGEELTRRNTIPGQHGNARRPKLTNYGIQLQEKQRIRHTYQLSEKQFYNTYLKASKKAGSAGENFLVMLESRLDNIVYRMGFATTRRGARQLVNHGHILVNGKKVDIPSLTVKVGDVIAVKETSKSSAKFKGIVEANTKVAPRWIDADVQNMTATVTALPNREDIDLEIAEHLIIELYSK